ncbi:hypothetical protein Hanom_Chr11g00976041 [Helianthus anomalus]
MDYGFIKLWRPYSFGGPRPKPHLAYPWADPGHVRKLSLHNHGMKLGLTSHCLM